MKTWKPFASKLCTPETVCVLDCVLHSDCAEISHSRSWTQRAFYEWLVIEERRDLSIGPSLHSEDTLWMMNWSFFLISVSSWPRKFTIAKTFNKPRYLKYIMRQPHSPAVCTSLNMFADRGTGQNSPVSLANLSLSLVAKISIHIFNPPSPDDYLSDSLALLLIWCDLSSLHWSSFLRHR